MLCRGCGYDLPEGAFYRHPKAASGFMSICRECHKRRVKTRAKTNPLVQEYERERAKTPKRREYARAISTRWREKNPQAYKAHIAVNNAVRDGRLFKEPCAICGAADVHAHHRDYAKPLDVVWLCPKCHHRLHAAFPELEGKRKAG